MAESIQTSIYRLRSEIAILDSDGKLKKINVDLAYLEKELVKGDYELQKIDNTKAPSHDLRLFYGKWSTKIKWKKFIEQIADPAADILVSDVSINEGFVLVVKEKRSKIIYAITGGFGHTEIQEFIDFQFGLEILARLIKIDDKVLRSAKERNFVGGVLGSVKYFRGDYNLNENENFGNYYHELRAKLDKDLLKSEFKFTDDELKRGGVCDAKTSFTIKKAVTFSRAVELVDCLHEVIKRKPIVDLNLIRKLDRSDRALVGKLENELYTQLYSVFRGSGNDVNFEVCHRAFDKYYEASEYEITCSMKKKSHEDKLTICNNILEPYTFYRKQAFPIASQTDLISLIEETKVFSYNDSGDLLTAGKLSDHLCAEIIFKGKSYFLFNQEWFLIKSDFVKTVNRQCQSFYNANKISLLQKWDTKTESENYFNAKHLSDNDTLVFDKVTPENIEICDILKWNKTEVFFIHVKEGFNNEMRNLGRQVEISARRISEDLRTGKVLLSKLYDTLAGMTAKEQYFIDAKAALIKLGKPKFLRMFDKKTPVFVVAVLDSSSKGKRDFSDITKYESNIAKFCLQELSLAMRKLDIALRITQIEKI